MELSPYIPSLVPPNLLQVETEVSEDDGPVEAGSGGLNLTCIVRETVNGLTNTPSGHWMGPSGLVNSIESIIMVETIHTEGIWSRVTITVSFSSLHTSHAGEYTCHWTLFTPAEEGKIVTNSSTPLTVTVRCKWCGRSLCSDGM